MHVVNALKKCSPAQVNMAVRGLSPLCAAIRYCRFELVRGLLKAGAVVDLNAIRCAVAVFNPDLLAQLLQAGLDERHKREPVSVTEAAFRGNTAAVVALIEAGFDSTSACTLTGDNAEGVDNPLSASARCGALHAALALCHSPGAEPSRWPSLPHMCVESGDPVMVALFAGKDEVFRRQPLLEVSLQALRRDRFSVFATALAYGCRVDVRSPVDSVNLLYEAVLRGKADYVLEVLRRLESAFEAGQGELAVQALFDSSRRKPDDDGMPALFAASLLGHADIVDLLLSSPLMARGTAGDGAPPMTAQRNSWRGFTPVQAARFMGHCAIADGAGVCKARDARFLWQVDAKDEDGAEIRLPQAFDKMVDREVAAEEARQALLKGVRWNDKDVQQLMDTIADIMSPDDVFVVAGLKGMMRALNGAATQVLVLRAYAPALLSATIRLATRKKEGHRPFRGDAEELACSRMVPLMACVVFGALADGLCGLMTNMQGASFRQSGAPPARLLDIVAAARLADVVTAARRRMAAQALPDESLGRASVVAALQTAGGAMRQLVRDWLGCPHSRVMYAAALMDMKSAWLALAGEYGRNKPLTGDMHIKCVSAMCVALDAYARVPQHVVDVCDCAFIERLLTSGDAAIWQLAMDVVLLLARLLHSLGELASKGDPAALAREGWLVALLERHPPLQAVARAGSAGTQFLRGSGLIFLGVARPMQGAVACVLQGVAVPSRHLALAAAQHARLHDAVNASLVDHPADDDDDAEYVVLSSVLL